MNSFLIQKYSPQRDKAQIEHMLLHNKDLLKSFYQNEESNRENIVIAIMNDTSIGFLSFNGFGRKPQAILFVNNEYDTMEVGSKLIEEYENMLIHNETVEHTVFNVLSNNAQLISVLEKIIIAYTLPSIIWNEQALPFLQRISWLEIMRKRITLNGTEFAN